MLRATVLLASVSLVMALPAATSDAAAAKSFTIRVYVKEVTQSVKDVPPKTFRAGHEYTKGDTIRGTDILRIEQARCAIHARRLGAHFRCLRVDGAPMSGRKALQSTDVRQMAGGK
jgi:hypothetical protein